VGKNFKAACFAFFSVEKSQKQVVLFFLWKESTAGFICFFCGKNQQEVVLHFLWKRIKSMF
jgi:hypothetical protein